MVGCALCARARTEEAKDKGQPKEMLQDLARRFMPDELSYGLLGIERQRLLSTKLNSYLNLR